MKIEICEETKTAVVLLAVCATVSAIVLGSCCMVENTNRAAIEKGIFGDVYRGEGGYMKKLPGK